MNENSELAQRRWIRSIPQLAIGRGQYGCASADTQAGDSNELSAHGNGGA